jgi:hypothetical protein
LFGSSARMFNFHFVKATPQSTSSGVCMMS